MPNLDKFYKNINYNFNNPNLLQEALTHPSLTDKNNKTSNYQRLEFLGDKVLSLVISDFLIHKYPDEMEGDLSKRHAALVSGETLAAIALNLEVEKFLLISNGEKNLNGHINKRNLENSLEAIIGAIYLDSNFDNAQKFVLNFWQFYLNQNIEPPKDPISHLQEIIQTKSKILPKYNIVKIGGSEHEPTFEAQIKIDKSEFTAQGKSKKEAQKAVAKLALDSFIES